MALSLGLSFRSLTDLVHLILIPSRVILCNDEGVNIKLTDFTVINYMILQVLKNRAFIIFASNCRRKQMITQDLLETSMYSTSSTRLRTTHYCFG